MKRSGAGRQRVVRARRTLLCGMVFWLLAQVLLAVGLEHRWPTVRDPEYGSRLAGVRSALQTDPTRPLVLFLGSSRTQLGIKPEFIAQGAAFPSDHPAPLLYNFGMAGCGPLGELLCLNRLLADDVRPAAVLIEVLPPALNCASDCTDLLRAEVLTWDDLRLARPYCRRLAELRLRWVGARLTPWFTARFSVLSLLDPGWLPATCRLDYHWQMCDALGWVKRPRSMFRDDVRARALAHARAEYRVALTDFQVTLTADRALRQTLDVCRTRNIRVGLYLMPEGTEFRGWYWPAARAALDRYLIDLADEYRLPLFDGGRWIGDTYFVDSHHLLPAGAIEFSERFGREALGPWLRSMAEKQPPKRAGDF